MYGGRFTWLAFSTCLAGCGAPLKSASSVASLFSSASTLQQLETTVCQDLATRTAEPTTQNLGFDIQGCQMAGQAALNYTQITAFEFVNIDGTAVANASGSTATSTSTGSTTASTSSGTTTAATGTATSASLRLDGSTGTTTTSTAAGTTVASTTTSTASGTAGSYSPPTISKSVRAEVWLNRSFLDLATSLTNYMKKNANAGPGAITLPNSSANTLSNLATPTITMTQAPTLNLSNLSFSMQIELKLTGIITVDQVIEIDGQLLDNSFAIVGHTLSNMPYSQSLIQNFQMVVIVIPYANDVYLDLFANLTMYDVGLQSIFNQQLSTFLSTGLKGIIDSLVAVGGSTS